MEKLFTIPACTTLIILFVLNLTRYPDDLIAPAIMITAGSFVVSFVTKHYTFSIFLISIAISLLAGQKFLTNKNIYHQKKELNVCREEYVKVRGKLLHFPVIGNGTSTILVKVKMYEGIVCKKHEIFVLKITANGDLRHLNCGDMVEIDTVINKPRPSVNFFPPRSDSYFFVNNIHFTGYSKSALLVERVKRSGILMRLTGRMREKIRDLIEKKYLKKDGYLKQEGQMLEALLLGDRGRLTPEVKEVLLKTGVFHLFAISGAHIGIIALFILFLLNRTGLRMRKKYLILILILFTFLLLTGFKISAQRAVLMATLISFAKMLYLKSDIINVISFTGFILLLKDPRYFLDPGFILTFTITAGIVSGRKIFFGETKKNSYLKEMIAANLNASSLSIPLSLFFFMRYSFTGILAGPVLLPLTALIMCLSLPLIPIAFLPPLLGTPFIAIQDLPLRIFFFLADSFSKEINLTIFRAPPITFILFISILLYFALCFFGKKTIFKICFSLLYCAALSVIVIKPLPYNPAFPEIYFLDVGQGDAHIVVLPGGDSLLIDGGGSRFGSFEVGKQIVLPFILRQGIRIKWIAISHYHPDHCRGINEIIDILNPEEIWISSKPDENIHYINLIDKCSGNIRIRKINSGFRIRKGNTLIELLYPFKFLQPFRTSNDHSQVIKISHKNKTILFTGDIEKMAEKELICRYGNKLKCNVLKVPHHGSGTSSSSGLLNMTNPDIAIFSLGHKNSFGFPAREVLERYEHRNIRLLYTSEHGGIRAILHPEGIIFEVSRFSKHRGVKF